MKKFRCYEDNGGGLHLFVLDDSGNVLAGFGGFQSYERGILVGAIAGIDDYESYCNEYGCEIDLNGISVSELYNELADDNINSTLIAWSDDGKSVHYCDVDRMGGAAIRALNLEI